MATHTRNQQHGSESMSVFVILSEGQNGLQNTGRIEGNIHVFWQLSDKQLIAISAPFIFFIKGALSLDDSLGNIMNRLCVCAVIARGGVQSNSTLYSFMCEILQR